jgi:hypothetical protein
MSLLEDFAKAIEKAIQIKSSRCSQVVQSTSMLVCPASSIRRHSCSLCVRACRVDIVEMLLSAGAHIDGVDDNGQTACLLLFGSQRRRVGCVARASAQSRNQRQIVQQTPLQFRSSF